MYLWEVDQRQIATRLLQRSNIRLQPRFTPGGVRTGIKRKNVLLDDESGDTKSRVSSVMGGSQI